jgi:hypothetical protein
MTSRGSREDAWTTASSRTERRVSLGLLAFAAGALVMHLVTAKRAPLPERNSNEAAAHSDTPRMPSYPPEIGTTESAPPPGGVRAAFKVRPVNRPDPLSVIGDARKWFDLARRGNPGAAQAVFSLLRNCRWFGPAITTLEPQQMSGESYAASNASDCRSVPENFGDDPFHWLAFAARNGDISSQVLYAQSAETLQADSRPQDRARRAAIRANALTYLEQSAARGAGDAYLLLASSYERGGLTRKDVSLSYAYYSALAAATGDPVAANKAVNLRSSLPDVGAAEAATAKLAARCCLTSTHRPTPEDEN